VQVFHYHLVTSRPRAVEARYVGKLGFDLIARYGRIGEDTTTFEPGTSWEQLDRLGFKLRLTELERGSVNIVVQPGQWRLPRVDHIGLALEDDELDEVLERAAERELHVQEHGGRRTFVATGAGYRLELHPPRDWLEELLAAHEDLSLAELHLLADDPYVKANTLGDLLTLEAEEGSVAIGRTLVRFLPGGPQGRPELNAELFS
jgi:hypothetical protein